MSAAQIAIFSVQYSLFLAMPAISRQFKGDIMPILLTTAVPFLAAYTGDSRAGRSVPLASVGFASAITFFALMIILQLKQLRSLLVDGDTDKLSGVGIAVMLVIFIISLMTILFMDASAAPGVPSTI
jgi:hypothetical protein